MIKTEPIIAVNDVAQSSKWYQQLLGCKSAHGGDVFEILTDDKNTQILSLHKWGEHDHPTFTNPEGAGNGLILYFYVDNFNAIWSNAIKMKLNVVQPPGLNPNSGRLEFSVRDLDNYYISVTGENKSQSK